MEEETNTRIKVIRIDYLGDYGQVIERAEYNVDDLPDVTAEIEYVIEEFDG